MENKETFNYTYSAMQQDEINAIREKYLPKAPPTDREEKLARLRKLDAGADKVGSIAAAVLGVVGVVCFACGMCCVTVWSDRLFVIGVVIGVIGIICMAAALPVCHMVTARKREQIAPEVLKLTEELSKEI